MQLNVGHFVLTSALVLAMASLVSAHDEDGHAGQAGDPAAVDRTIEVVMGDVFFEPAVVKVAPGETIRFRVRNDGNVVHEFNIGTSEMHEGHQAEMVMMVEMGVLELDRINHDMMGEGGMNHDDPNAVLLEPGQSAELVWQFPDGGVLQFACNVPGHYEAGMVGDFIIDANAP